LIFTSDLKLNQKLIFISSSYDSLRKHDFTGDFKYIIIDRIMPPDYKLTSWENFVLTLNSIARRLSINDIKALELDSTNTIVEQVPITVDQEIETRIKRIS
jgi:KUP system potassium uptake protein